MPQQLPKNLGANIDSRPLESKVKDIHFVELVSKAAPVEWKEKSDSQWRSFPVQNQGTSESCVPQTIKKLAGIQLFLKEGKYVEFSATPIYQKRSNRPAGGMIGIEAFDLWRQDGLTLEALVPSSEMSNEQMDAFIVEQYEKDIAKVFTIGGHVGIANADFDTVASVIQETSKGVMSWFYFTAKEWERSMPSSLSSTLDLYEALRHSVAVTDFGLINGKEYLKIEDSAHFGGISERWISREFFNARNWFNRYAMNFTFQDPYKPPATDFPRYIFKQVLEFIPLTDKGTISNIAKHEAQKADVIALQNILKYEGFFPLNVASTGYYGATTAKGVYAYQVKHNVASLGELDSIVPKGGRVGTKTIIHLNENYG